MSEHWTERLSDYLDGELNTREREACEAHLAECRACAGTLEGLRAVVAQASLLPDLPSERDLWPDIEARLTPRASQGPSDSGSEPSITPDLSVLRGARRRVSLTVPQLMAAAIALVVLSVAAVQWLLPSAEPAGISTATSMPAAAASSQAEAAAGVPVLFTPAWDQAVRDLEAEFQRRRGELDPETIRVVEENLAIIDTAIAEANHALAEDPSSAFLSTHLASAMRQKVDLLRRVTAIDRTET